MNTRLQTQTKAAPTPTFTPVSRGLLQRKCACGSHVTAGEHCKECGKKGMTLQRRAPNQTEPTEVPPIVHEVLRSPGWPLDAATRAFFEPRFGHDFSQVRVHTDSRAAESARAMSALAYTVGRDIVFDVGPGTSAGNRLLAHELTHAVQQTNVTDNSLPRLSVSDQSNDKSEREADQMSENIFAGDGLDGKCPKGLKGIDRTPSSGVFFGSLSSASHGLIQRKCNEHNQKAFYEAAPNYCKDDDSTGQLHAGKICFRQFPLKRSSYRDCPPGDHVCFDPQGRCDDHEDMVSPVASKKRDGT